MTRGEPLNVFKTPLSDDLPLVAYSESNRPLWIGLTTIGLCGLVLFLWLNAGRNARVSPAVLAPLEAAIAPSATPITPLYVPPDNAPFPSAPVPLGQMRERENIFNAERQRSILPALATRPAPSLISRYAVAPSQVQALPAQPASNVDTTALLQTSNNPNSGIGESDASSAIIFDGSPSGAKPTTSASNGTNVESTPIAVATRPVISRSPNRSMVVSQGTLVNAVLETALDSTQAGPVRALVSEDVRARRSSRILIPRGSRLYGTYQGELAQGQKRILVQWARLVRPDGVTVAIDSPATDRLGRAGIGGKVNSHFLSRIGGALFQSAIDIGSILAARSANNSPILVTVPGRVAGVTNDLIGPPPKPIVTVRAGARISVFVVRDLDFGDVESLR